MRQHERAALRPECESKLDGENTMRGNKALLICLAGRRAVNGFNASAWQHNVKLGVREIVHGADLP